MTSRLRTFILSLLSAAVLIASAVLYPLDSQATLVQPVTIAISQCETLEIPAPEVNEATETLLSSMTAVEIQTLRAKRSEIFADLFEMLNPHLRKIGFLRSPISCLTRNGRSGLREKGLKTLATMFSALDREILRSADRVANCSRWGVCTSLDIHAGFGFLKYYAALGGALSWDVTTTFEKDTWDKQTYLDTATGSKAYSPVAAFNLGVTFIVHFDEPTQTSFRDFKAVYLPAVPMTVSGDDTFGYGLRAGLGLPPGISSLYVYEHNMRRRTFEDVKAKCVEFLTGLRRRLLPNETPAP